MNVYVAGPVTGIPGLNADAFAAATAALQGQGHVVCNPVASVPSDASYRLAMASCTQWICLHAEAIALLPGWERSKGARAELALAESLGLSVIHL